MTQLLDLVTEGLVGLSPLLLVGALLALAAWRDRRALAATARRTRLTDALADEMGAVVAPVVRRRLGHWRVRIAVPFGRPAVVARVLEVLDVTLGRLGPDRYEIVLSPQEPGCPTTPRRGPAGRHPRPA